MNKKLFQVDAFTSTVFKGNPAGVLISDETLSDEYMQNMAAEMNLSETAFVTYGDGCFNVRFFTPYAEIPLCGHATLAAASVLFDQKIVDEGERIHFKTLHHSLFVSGDNNHLKMDFPILGIKKIDDISEFSDTTGLIPEEVYQSDHGWYIAWFKSVEEVHRAHPRVQHMRHSEFGHLIIAARANKKDGYDNVLRVFVPALGIDEDPVTGSAQCIIAPLMKQKYGIDSYTSYQASKRTGLMKVRKLNDERIEIEGSAVIVFEAVLR